MNPNTHIQPKQSRLVTYACAAGMEIQPKHTGRAMALARRIGLDCQPKKAARRVTHACRIGMDFDSTD